MEIFRPLPKSQRNIFSNPRQHLEALPDGSIEQHDRMVGDIAVAIISILCIFRGQVTVKDILEENKRVLRQVDPTLMVVQSLPIPGYNVTERIFLTAMKFLANDGFIKLGNAGRFEDRKVLKYYANIDAVPKFQSGKFQL